MKNQFHYFAMPFFMQSVGGKKDAKECGDDDLGSATMAALGLPSDDAKTRVKR